MATKPMGGGAKGLCGRATKKRFFLRLPLTYLGLYRLMRNIIDFNFSHFSNMRLEGLCHKTPKGGYVYITAR